MKKVIIVEGKTDRNQLLKVLDEPVDILCTFGTINSSNLEKMLDEIDDYEWVYVLVDADEAGNKLRKNIKHLFPNFKHLYTRKMYREVATTPLDELKIILQKAYFIVKDVDE